MFPDPEHIRDMQKDLDEIIRIGVVNITRLLRNTETGVTSGITDTEDDFEMKSRARMQKKKDRFLYVEEPVETLKTDEQKTMLEKYQPLVSKNPTDTISDSPQAEPPKSDQLSVQFEYARKNGSLSMGDAFQSRLTTPVHKSFEFHPRRRLTDQLVEQGLISQEMLEQLQQEMLDEVKEHEKAKRSRSNKNDKKGIK